MVGLLHPLVSKLDILQSLAHSRVGVSMMILFGNHNLSCYYQTGYCFVVI